MSPTSWVKKSEAFLNFSIAVAGHVSLQILALSNWKQILSWKYFFWDKQIKNNKDQKEEKWRLMPKFQFFRLNQGLTECTARLWIHLQPVWITGLYSLSLQDKQTILKQFIGKPVFQAFLKPLPCLPITTSACVHLKHMHPALSAIKWHSTKLFYPLTTETYLSSEVWIEGAA